MVYKRIKVYKMERHNFKVQVTLAYIIKVFIFMFILYLNEPLQSLLSWVLNIHPWVGYLNIF